MPKGNGDLAGLACGLLPGDPRPKRTECRKAMETDIERGFVFVTPDSPKRTECRKAMETAGVVLESS